MSRLVVIAISAIKNFWQCAIVVAQLGNLAVTGSLLSDRDEDKQEEGPVMGEKAGKSPDFTEMESDLQGFRDDVAILPVTLNELPPRGGTALLDGKLGERVREKIAEIERVKTAQGNEGSPHTPITCGVDQVSPPSWDSH